MKCPTSGARTKSVLYHRFRWSRLITSNRGSIKVGQATIIAESTVWSLPSVTLVFKTYFIEEEKNRTGQKHWNWYSTPLKWSPHYIKCIYCLKFVFKTSKDKTTQNICRIFIFHEHFFCRQKEKLCVHLKPGKISTTGFRISKT